MATVLPYSENEILDAAVFFQDDLGRCPFTSSIREEKWSQAALPVSFGSRKKQDDSAQNQDDLRAWLRTALGGQPKNRRQ